MGWKMSLMMINSEQEFDKDDLFESLGYSNLKKVDTQDFESVMNPDFDKIYLGKYNGNYIICMQEMAADAIDRNLSKAEKILSTKFTDTEIITFVLQSVVNLWGYSVAKNGEKIRARSGNSEEGTTLDVGTILEEEKELFSQSKTNEKGERIFVFEGMEEEEYSEDQVGENFVFDISKKYLGEDLDSCDALFETKFEGYTFSRLPQAAPPPIEPEMETAAQSSVSAVPAPISVPVSVPQNTTPQSPTPQKKEAKKPWWKFW